MKKGDRRGFTLVELIIVAVLGAVVVGSTYEIMLSSQRAYTVQTAQIQGQQTVRAGIAILFSELREMSRAEGDILTMGSDRIEVRAMRAFGLVCGVGAAGSPIRVKRIGRFFESGDSIVVLADNDPDVSSDDTILSREVIRWEAEQHVPFDIKSVELDFQILNPFDEGLHIEVLLVAAKRELVDNKVSLLLDAGLSPVAIDVDAFALHNAFEHNYPEAMEGIVALVNVGHETTNVNVLEDGNPILTRDIPFGSRRVREDLQREKGLTAEQAEDVVQGREELADLYALVESSADEVAVGIERASAFLMTRQDGGGLGRIYVSGGGARIPGMTDSLSRRMNLEADVVNPFEQVPVQPAASETILLEEAAPMLLLPLGLALRTL